MSNIKVISFAFFLFINCIFQHNVFGAKLTKEEKIYAEINQFAFIHLDALSLGLENKDNSLDFSHSLEEELSPLWGEFQDTLDDNQSRFFNSKIGTYFNAIEVLLQGKLDNFEGLNDKLKEESILIDKTTKKFIKLLFENYDGQNLRNRIAIAFFIDFLFLFGDHKHVKDEISPDIPQINGSKNYKVFNIKEILRILNIQISELTEKYFEN